jgi:type II secretory pathway pseudopilin PulG
MMMKAKKGFTLVEVVVVFTLMGLGIFLLFGTSITNAPKAGARSTAIALCRGLDAAKQSYRMRVPTADAQWAALASDDTKYARLRDPNGDGILNDSFLPMAPASRADYLPSGYSVQLGALYEKCVLSDASGVVSY